MKDIDVRRAVHSKILKEHHKDPNTLIIDEFSLNQGSCRVDIAVINGVIHGYELKSERDNLLRLPNQIEQYSLVMDKVTLVVDDSHLAEAQKIIPEWWGIKVVNQGNRGAVHIHSYRRDKLNPDGDVFSLARLLWKDECLSIMEKWNILKGNKSKPRFELWDIVAQHTSLEKLKVEVRHTLKQRTMWRN
ncbi:hypothetical protein Xvie_04033 [Xenorhabdus vietnamensis]|uniref:Sce7726 family protein n=1 Tax=Xenorhabdus vietnamensis TaxID=351656 RepID=A0A1Y2S608_9GAMM|nr:sce7726 family protein [Xenorhabdus vietnamensis]OTA14068.1 hypothetical protein Xvie_04033 [Xenorhabdus vietnamensis]